jgi:hypothetical protein
MTEPRQIYVGSLSRRDRRWGRPHRRAPLLSRLLAVAVSAAVLGATLVPNLRF